MKNTVYIILSMFIILIGCTEKNSAIDWDKRLKTKVEPFVVEHFELITESDSALVLYFNRDIDEKEDAFIYIHTIIHGGLHFGAKPLTPITTKNRKFTLKLPIPDSLSHRKRNDGLTTTGQMMNLFRARWNSLDSIDLIEFTSTMSPMMPKFRFMNGKFDPFHSDFLSFKKEVKIVNDYNSPDSPWRRVLLSNYHGTFDKAGLKQGDWEWSYSNGSVLATASFINDTLTDNLFIFDYRGNCIDTILAK